MTVDLAELVEAQIAGEDIEVPAAVRDEFERAMAAHKAIQYALGETLVVTSGQVDDRPPPVLPSDYEIMREIGRGGMGVVYLARQKSLGRQVAVKVLRPGEMTFAPLLKRFVEEARHLARLRHANIVAIHEIGHAENEPYFTMDYVEGESLSAVLARERLTPTRALAILKQVAEAVQHAHGHGIIHRDLKPGNILLDAAGHAYVTDFGLARDMTQTSKVTRSGEVMGTPAYMAPEQAQGQVELIGEATDVHALGLILYEMLTGRPPYGCDAPANVLVRLLREEVVPLRRIDRRIPHNLETICLKAIAKAPDRRYASVHAFLQDIRRYESGEPVLARRPSLVYHATRFARRHWKLAATALATAAVLVALAPRLFDKTVEELVALAEEDHVAGEHARAARVLRKAYQKAPPAQRGQILERLLRCCKESGDMKATLETCLAVVDEYPERSFDEHDYLVAQAIAARIRAKDVNRSLRFATADNRSLLKLAEKRFEVFLRGPHGTNVQRKEAQDTLAGIRLALANEPLKGSPSLDLNAQLPQGAPDSLLQMSEDPKQPVWNRAKAAYARGLALERTGELDAAKAAFRHGFELMRSVYPTYAGIGFNRRLPEEQYCRMLQDAFTALRRLAPEMPDALQGGIRLTVQGLQIPPEINVALSVIICDPSIKDPDEGLRQLLSRHIAIREDQTAWVGVADGRYRMAVRESGRSFSGDVADSLRRVYRLLVLDFDKVPSEVEIQGNVQEFIIAARLAAEINLAQPHPEAAVDLSTDLFRWTEVPNAAYYRINFGYQSDTGEGSTYYGVAGLKVRSTVLSLAQADDPGVAHLRRSLMPGRTGMWYVEAFDAADHCIGRSLEHNRSFLVASGLDNK